MRFEVAKDIEICRQLWERHWQGSSLFDDWAYRSSFYDPSVHELYFIIGHEPGREVGMLPLWKSSKSDYYEWFGGEFPERNKVPVPDEYLWDFLGQIPGDAWLPYIDPSATQLIPFSEGEGSFYLDLESFSHEVDSYLSTFSKKHKKNLLRDLDILSSLSPQVVRNDLGDFDIMANLNRLRFPEGSFFAEKEYVEGFKRLLELAASRSELEMISIRIDGKTQAAEAAIFHAGTYTVLLGGANLEVRNIGKMLILEHIKNAMALKAKEIDFLAHDSGWKRLWNMSERKWREL